MTDPRTLEQGSDAWKAARLGFVTASNIAEVMSKGKGNAEAIGRYKYKISIVAERLTGASAESFSNEAMAWGIQQETFAAIAYEAEKGVLVEKTGFWPCEEIKFFGASPDRLVGSDGILEIKCPQTNTHLDNIFNDVVPSRYFKQIQAQLFVTGRQYCDFVSFDPRLPKRNQLFIKRVERDEVFIEEMKFEVIKFLDEVETLIGKLNAD